MSRGSLSLLISSCYNLNASIWWVFLRVRATRASRSSYAVSGKAEDFCPEKIKAAWRVMGAGIDIQTENEHYETFVGSSTVGTQGRVCELLGSTQGREAVLDKTGAISSHCRCRCLR